MNPPVKTALDLDTDGHVHTSLCGHASGSMEDYVRAAIRRGLSGLIFLEHLEDGIDYFERTWLTEEDFDRYFAEGNRLREEYGDRLAIGLGVEVGYNPDRREEILSRLAGRPWDRVAISYHFLRAGDRHYNLVSRKDCNMEALGRLGVERVLTDYFAVLHEAVETIPGQVVCHLDAAMRYHPEVRLTGEHRGQVSRILEVMSQKEMALEVNASGFRLRGEPYPRLDIIEEAVAMGIPLAVGSDAHRPEDVGNFGRLAEMFG